ncbi:MAG: efflux transporter outer membrane subunit [Syntrophales bacterium]|nr:efflux transporter outer membrane subunit [Syntrophales bacterium]
MLLCILAVSVSSCSLAPKYEMPSMPIPSQLPYGEREKGDTIKWEDFVVDERLKKIVALALENSRDVKLAALNVAKIEAMYRIQKAELLPSVSAGGGVARQRVPADLSPTRRSTTTSQYDVTVGITSWEVDFFGRLQSLRDQALEEYLASEQGRIGIRNTIVALVAKAYLSYAANREQYAMAEKMLKSQEETYRLVRRLYEAGMASEIDLKRAETLLNSSRVDIARYEQACAQDENTLHLLVGRPISKELLPGGLREVVAPKEFAIGLSSSVLLRRPDVKQAEHLLKAAHANVGAARAAFFPRIVLTTSFGTASAELSGLFKDGSFTWSFVPRLVMPIFDARTWAAYDVSKVHREMALTQYEKTIQTAFKEVADALVTKVNLEKQIEAQEAVVSAARDTYRLAKWRYEKGLDSYLSVLDAERSLISAERGLVNLHLARMSNLVVLYQALGGGTD